MPGHRKPRQFKQTDAFTRGMVIGLKRAGWSIRQIAADTHLGASTVHRLWRRWLEQENVAIYRNVGATRVTSARVDRRILRQAVAAPQATCTAILQHVQDTLDHSISTRTISRRLVANGLHSCRPLRRLPLTPPNRRQRLEWCRARSTWMTEWHRVVSNPAAIVERPTVRQRGIMVWGAIASDSRSPLLRIQGTMTAQRYVDDVLRPVTLPYLQGVPNALYQQDNARPHTARISQQALQDVQMLPWPPYSPDLSPIEHVWDIIGRRLHALPPPRSEDELWQMVEREWRAIPQDAIRTLFDSLPRPVAACIAVRVVVIGAGPSGLPSIKSCLEEGLDVVCFEKEDSIGGIWNFRDEKTSPLTPGTLMNTNKLLGSYSDFAAPENFPIYLPHRTCLEYLNLYADKFDLHSRVRLQHKVTAVLPLEDGRWEVKVTDPSGRELTELADCVMVCVGHHSVPEIPNIPGRDIFRGKVVHSLEYLGPESHRGERVLIVGGGNTAGDIAHELSPVAGPTNFDVNSTVQSWWKETQLGQSTEELLKDNQIDQITVKKISKLIAICLETNNLTYVSKTYEQIKGSPMGKSLSTSVAEIVMRRVDSKVEKPTPGEIPADPSGATLLNILNNQQRMINKLLELQLGMGQERIPVTRMDIEKFNGRNMEPSIWITNFEVLCENNNWNSCRTRINGMRAHLEDTALAWYDSHDRSASDEDREEWRKDFVEAFHEDPISKYDKAIKWQYRNGSYVDYFYKKLRLLQLGLPGAPEKVLITGILYDLPVEMQQRLAVTQFATLMELRKVLERHRPCVECIDLELEIDNHKIKVTAIVLEDMPFEILIGKPTMKNFRIKWDFGTDDIRCFSLRSGEVVATIDDLRTKFPELCHTSKNKFPKSEVDFLLKPNNNIVACKPYPMSDHKRRWTARKIEELLARGIITRSNSEYASPCILVPKKDSSYRLCIDYRRLNQETFLDPFPFPRIDTIINQFGGCQYFTKIDLKDSFWQVGLTKATRRFSAFATPDGLYEFTRLPFGWKNSPPKFQRVISEILDDLLERRVVVYLDDICCGAPTLDECASLTYDILHRLNKFNMTVNLDKCHICVAEVELLGRIINGNSKQMKEEVIEKAKLMKRPYDLKSLQCFTGFTGHFRAYIPNYSKICEEAYLKLIDIITSKPILAIPDESLPYELSTDASYYGTGAVLYQRDVNKKKPHQLRVISYYSYTFSRAEQNYSITEKECLAVLKAVKHLRFYLEGKPFVVHTDHRALTQLLSCGHLRDRLARWQLFLSSFEMKVNHRSGRELSDADALSRLAIEIPNDNSQAVLFFKHQSIPLKLENYNKYFVI
ncbi:K02A2.6-like [Cordylochernes scorpioides]|uniref:Flavin-containing monooxygenase n=1 Tax=Cordylochernes scorpioides TaxID=51811 RepID=A0ABY6LRH8_9ARAC|nr:K02A2.6-like [Cordylochernes scorpioides]